MKALFLSRPMPLVKRAFSDNNKRLMIRLFTVALALCISTVTDAREPAGTFWTPVSPGWNLLSLPASVTSWPPLFPSAVSPPYVFQYPDGYLPQGTLQNGMGFWLKFASSDTVPILGGAVFKDTIQVQEGWNIIGSLSEPIAVGSIATEPPGIIASEFSTYLPGIGYRSDTTLYPGYGYWVKVSQSGSIVLSSGTGSPCPGMPTVFYAGRTYNTMQIGTQCWLRENLDVGTMILGSQEQTDNSTIEKYCQDNNSANCDAYGGLYQWNEAMQYDTVQGEHGICPPGWHMPTIAEFDALDMNVGGDGNALKALGQGTDGGVGTNTSGFSALLAGYRGYDGGFYSLGFGAILWGSSQRGASDALILSLGRYSGGIYMSPNGKALGFSIRCLKD